jgi:DNA polymerase III psi subunit
MAAASNQTLAERLQVKGDQRLAALNGPLAISDALAGERERVSAQEADVIVLFVSDRAEFDLLLPDALKAMQPNAILWLAYPKLSSTLAGDLNRELIHSLSAALCVKTVAQVALGTDWSAVRLKRLAKRTDEG